MTQTLKFHVYIFYSFLVLCCLCRDTFSAGEPNIILIVADDLGWNDVSFHGSNQIPTPNIDALAYNGVILNSHYVQSVCTPSRAALLTGKYPYRLGMQGISIDAADKRALPPVKLLPEYLKELGYSTNLVGKWHLGYSRWSETPTAKGFDHFFGFYNEFTSYYDYVSTWTYNNMDYSGFDLRRDKDVAWDVAGKYATDAFTEHAVELIQNHDFSKPLFLMMSHLAVHAANEGKVLEAPQQVINRFKHIIDPNRRTYAAMVSKLDESVGNIVEALQAKEMLQNSVIVFLSDNGAPTVGEHRNWGSNYPLRGIKDTLFEGGIRGVSFVYSPLIIDSGRVLNDLVHITDWLPTLYTAAGGDIGALDPELDGIDQWSTLVYALPSARNDILINIDEESRNAALRFYNWKLIVGSSQDGKYNSYFGDSGLQNLEQVPYNTTAVSESPAGRSIRKISYTPITEIEYESIRNAASLHCINEKMKKNFCDPISGAVCLYDVPSDPCEENDLAKFFPSVVRRMKRALVDYRKGLVPQIKQEIDIERADPKLFKYTWNPWVDCTDVECTA